MKFSRRRNVKMESCVIKREIKSENKNTTFTTASRQELYWRLVQNFTGVPTFYCRNDRALNTTITEIPGSHQNSILSIKEFPNIV